MRPREFPLKEQVGVVGSYHLIPCRIYKLVMTTDKCPVECPLSKKERRQRGLVTVSIYTVGIYKPGKHVL